MGLAVDGMGGLQFGAAAAIAVVNYFREFNWQALSQLPGDREVLSRELQDAVNASHQRVCLLPEAQASAGQLGAAMCAAVLWDNRYCVAHVGDSRCYYVNSEGIRGLTEDQSLASQGQAHVLTNSLGDPHFMGPVLHPELPLVGILEEPCTFVIVTDGVHGVVGEDAIFSIVQACGHSATPEAAQRIVKMAFTNGSLDNMSCVLLSSSAKSGKDVPAKRGWRPFRNRVK